MVAGMMAAIVLGGITISLSQLGSAKAISRQRLEAYSRCDMALRTLRRDAITFLRRGDLFDTRFFITDSTSRYQGLQVQRDELLLFNGNLRANKEIDFNGEGLEYETQFRIEYSDDNTFLWKRRDPILDDNPTGGGIAVPIAEGIVSLQLEAFDGEAWYGQWDSDELGIPEAIRITVVSNGAISQYEAASTVTMRTIVPLDRVRSPDDRLALIAQELEDERIANGELPGTPGIGSGEIAETGSDTGDSGSAANTGGTDTGEKGTSGGNSSGTTTFTDPDGNVHEIPNS